jgi:predicted lipid-binding transport protein (Tim44 family)
MGNMIGILSTVILVSTLATLIFAIGAYIMARRRRRLATDAGDNPEMTEIDDSTPPLVEAPGTRARSVEPPAVEAVPVAPAVAAVAAVEAVPPAAGNGAKPVFRRLTPQGDEPVAADKIEKKPGWDWE